MRPETSRMTVGRKVTFALTLTCVVVASIMDNSKCISAKVNTFNVCVHGSGD
jgi:hypothetical protein